MNERHGVDTPSMDMLGRPIGEPQPPATPRWVKVTGIVIGLFLSAVLVKALLGGDVGGHGPGMHGSLGDTAPATFVSSPAFLLSRSTPGL